MADGAPAWARRVTSPRFRAGVAVPLALGAACYVWLLVIEWDDPVGRVLNNLCLATSTFSAASFGYLALQERRRRRSE